MNSLPSPTHAAVEYLVNAWGLPEERKPEVLALLEEQNEGGTTVRLPENLSASAAAWGRAAVLSTTSATGPLVLDPATGGGSTYLQSWRYFSAEREIAQRLRHLASLIPEKLTAGAVDAGARTDQTPPADDLGLNDEQRAAIRCGLDRRLTLITGGPGTGKTHTLARLLALMIAAQPGHSWVVKLAAPTGKATDRMREAIEYAVKHLPAAFDQTVRKRLHECAKDAATLHRLLGYNPATGRCAASAEAPLPADVVIVDECSMIDTLLWQALLAALGDRTRLILLGDPNQLESVSAGDVLGSIVRHVRAAPDSDPLRAAWTELKHARRFDSDSALAKLSRLVIAPGKTDEALSVLHANSYRPTGEAASNRGSIAWMPAQGQAPSWSRIPAPVMTAIRAVATESDPAKALAALNRVRILAASRKGPWGVTGLNRTIERHLKEMTAGGQPPNLPIIINRNDPETGLKNGSVGIAMSDRRDDNEARYAYFPAQEIGENVRRIPESRLPADRSPAWAMTIHRSQGSEFDHVMVVLPMDSESPLASRELLYTAVTRTKVGAYLWGDETVIRAALENNSGRSTRLEARLKDASTRA